MYFTVRQPKNSEEAQTLKNFFKKRDIKLSDGAMRYSLDYCDYSGWDDLWTSITISTSRHGTWAEKSSGDGLTIDELIAMYEF
jgi:hypothetical protein